MFKESFKYYKSKQPPPNWDEVLDFDAPDKIRDKVSKVDLGLPSDSGSNLGLNPLKTWEIYRIIDHPGLLYVKNPFTCLAQRYWMARCLRDYSRKGNKSNLDPFNLIPVDKEWWELCQDRANKNLVNKLRWITLGYHHNWDTKVYSEELKSEFPPDLGHLSQFILQNLGFESFKAEAAIVNYYHLDSTLSGHTDHSEQDLEAPLISFSFGQTAVFLIGGKTREEKPLPIFLRSGDIVVMSKESRLCYHGVPKILKAEHEFWENFNESGPEIWSADYEEDVLEICQDRSLWAPFGSYLHGSRLNVNVRQVLRRGQKRLCSDSEADGFI